MTAGTIPSTLVANPASSGRSVTTGPDGMRISGGEDRGRRLRSAKSASLRPTSERVRGALFSIVGAGAVEGARVLDLYAGTGVLGIEALSRGASWADFVEVHAGRCRDIKASLAELGFADRARVHRGEVERALDSLEGGYGLVLADPPYDDEPWEGLMGRLEVRQLLDEGGLLVAEHHHKSELDDRYGGLVRQTERRYGDTSLSIYRAER